MSPIRQPQLRNFAANSMAWTDAKTALDVTDQSHDFTFEIEFKCVKTNAVYIFAADGSNDFIRVFMSSGEIIVSTALLSTASGRSTQFSAGSDSTNRHALTVKMIENTITALIDGEIVYTRENLVRNAIEISAPRSNAGYVYKISITDDTTGEIVWQAAHSDLYDTSNPWPSPVPRNFASAEWRWYNAVNPILSLGTDDLEFYIQYQLKGYRGGSEINSLFYFNSQNGSINLAFQGDGTASNYSYIKLNGVADYVIPLDLIKQLGTHSIRIRRTGTTVTIEFDGTVLTELTASEITATTAGVYPVTRFDGVIYDCYWKNLRTNRKVWQYPNDAEKVQLITNNNIKTENGQFEQANPSYEARLDTALDLRGKISSYTTIVDFDTVPFTISVAGQKQELAGQGPSVAYGAQYKVICSIGHGSSGNMQLSQEIAGARQIIAANPGKVEGRYILAGVVQLDIPNNTTRLALYFNGELLVEQTFAGLPTGTTHAAYTNFAIWDNRNGAYTQMYGAVHGAFLLDTALDDAQLKVLTAP